MCAVSDAARARREASEALLRTMQEKEARWQQQDARTMKTLFPTPTDDDELNELWLKIVGAGNGH